MMRVSPVGDQNHSGPILLTVSFTYERDLINEQPDRANPEARLIANLYDGQPVRSDATWRMMKARRKRIISLEESYQIPQYRKSSNTYLGQRNGTHAA